MKLYIFNLLIYTGPSFDSVITQLNRLRPENFLKWSASVLNFLLINSLPLIYYYTNLIPAYTPCFFCNNEPETNNHIWQCPQVTSLIYNCTRKAAYTLIHTIHSLSQKSISQVTETINNSPIFAWTLSPNEHTPSSQILLIIHQIIPSDLIKLIKILVPPPHPIKALIFNFMLNLTNDIYINIWKVRNHLCNIWKETLNIKKKDFTSYRSLRTSSTNDKSATATTSRKRKRSRFVPNTSHIPIYKDGFLPKNPLTPVTDWIKWTSSNFRHHIPWNNTFYYHNNINTTSTSPMVLP